jgi:hypothetical protein
MPCLLLNTAPDLSDFRVEVLDNRCRAAGAMCGTPTRLGWVVTEARDLLRRPDFAPDIARDTHLGNGDLVRIFKSVDPTLAVKRFANRAAGAKRTAQLLLGKFITNEESKAMEHDEMQEFSTGPGGHNADDPTSGFVPAVGMRVTILANEAMGYPEEHGVVSEDGGDGTFTVTADPAYRGDAADDGERLVELRDLAPDPVGEMRQKAEAVSAKDEKAAAKTAKAADREAKKQAREAATAQKKADREAKSAAKSVPKARVGRSSKLDDTAVIHLVSEKNPKRAGSKAFGYWESLRNGMTVKEAMDAGVPRGDILWNRDKNFIRVGT